MNLKDRAGEFGRFDVAWTPTVLICSPKGVERWRLEGFLTRDEFRCWLEMGLGRVAFTAKRFAEAEPWYDSVANRLTSHFAPEAIYWRAVCKYSQSHDASYLQEVAQELTRDFPESIWSMKTLAWLPADHPANRASMR